jgi:hypothetical protein
VARRAPGWDCSPHATAGATSPVADSALASADNLQKLAEPQLQWLPRGPAMGRAAPAVLAQAAPPTMAPLREGARSRVRPSPAGGGAPRWVPLDAAQRQPPAQRALDKQWRKQRAEDGQACKSLGRPALACEVAAQPARAHVAAGVQTPLLPTSTVCPTPP